MAKSGAFPRSFVTALLCNNLSDAVSTSEVILNSRVAPKAQWHDGDYASHVVQFYSDDDFLVDALGRFVGLALGAGDTALVVATQAHRDALENRLERRGFDVPSAAERGRYIALDAAQVLSQFMSHGMPDLARFHEVIGGVITVAREAAEPGHRLVVFGEMVALLWSQGQREAAIQLERLWNDLASSHSFSLRCAYPLTGFDQDSHGKQFLQICAEHSAVIPDEAYSNLVNDEERLRNISYLQQRAQALATEKAEREQAESSLRLREAELTDFLENAAEGVQRVGSDQKIRWANRTLLRMLGYSADEYAGHPLIDFHVDQDRCRELWQRLLAREDVNDFPAELRCRDGSTRHVLINSNALWINGEFVHTRCFIRDVTEQKQAEDALRESEARLRRAKEELEVQVQQRTAALRQLSARILVLQDSERRRIARELHDSLGQYLAVLKLNLELLRGQPHKAELWAQSEKLMESCISETRTLSYLLHPPLMDEGGLAPAARWYVEGFATRSGLRIKFRVPDDLPRLHHDREVALFRILQEALTNVHRHARAHEINIEISCDAETLVLAVTDDGRGINADQLRRFGESGVGMGVGLTGIRERVREVGGVLTMESSSKGTVIRVSVPIQEA